MITANVNWFNLYWNELNSFFSYLLFTCIQALRYMWDGCRLYRLRCVSVCVCARVSENVFLLLTSMSNEQKKMWQFSLLFNFTVMETSRSLMCDFGWIRVCVRLYINESVHILASMWVSVHVLAWASVAHSIDVWMSVLLQWTVSLVI